MSEQDDYQEPLSKRQKRGQEAVPEQISFGGPMYDEATARKMLKEAVLVPAERAVDGEAVIGFDPEDAALDNVYWIETDRTLGNMTPMIYFALKGDAKMCRYLISRGASTTKNAEEDFPINTAAQKGHLEICKLLYANGAQNDIRRDNGYGWTPFNFAARHRRDELVRWLTLHCALCADDDSDEIDGSIIYPMPYRTDQPQYYIINYGEVRQNISSSCDALVAWAEEAIQSHSVLITFLGGALPPTSSHPVRISPRRQRLLQCLSGHPGVRKHIADFVGLEVTKAKQLRILRNVVEVLPSFIKR